MFRYLYFLLIVLQICTLSLNASPHRAMWVVRYTLLDDQETNQLISTAKRLNLTDLYVQVRALGKFFNSDEQALTESKNSKAHKNFIEILKQAHKQNIRVHAWLNIFFIYQRADSLTEKTHLVSTEEDYFLRDAFADSVPNKSKLKNASLEGIYIDPLSHKNYNYLTNEIVYLIDSLKVDGIHLDYFRYPNCSYSFSPKGRAAFIIEDYVDPVSIYNDQNGMGLGLRSTLDEKYKKFLRKNLTEFLSGIRHTTNSKHRQATLSIAVKPDWEDAKNIYLQNWQDWLNKGLCDRVVLMNYSVLDSIFYKNIFKAGQRGNTDKIMIGVATYNLDTEPIVKRLRWLDNNRFGGFALFSYNDLLGKPDLIKRLENDIK